VAVVVAVFVVVLVCLSLFPVLFVWSADVVVVGSVVNVFYSTVVRLLQTEGILGSVVKSIRQQR